MYLTLLDLKRHLNVDHSEDDAYIVELERTAEDYCATYLQQALSNYCDATTGMLKPSIRHAIRLLVGEWYASREDVTFGSASTIPNGVNALLAPLKKFDHASGTA